MGKTEYQRRWTGINLYGLGTWRGYPQDRVNRKVYQGDIPGRSKQGGPRKRWLDGVQKPLSRNGVKTKKNGTYE